MQNTLALVVTTPPNSNLTTSAINLVHAAIENNVKVIGVFFYQDGVLNAAKNLSIPSDEYQTLIQWKALNREYSVPLYLCITAAEKRGLLVRPIINMCVFSPPLIITKREIDDMFNILNESLIEVQNNLLKIKS